MTDASLRIKNLSISLEALSRTDGPNTARLSSAIETLLEKEIEACHKEQNPIRTVRSTIPISDDDIPF